MNSLVDKSGLDSVSEETTRTFRAMGVVQVAQVVNDELLRSLIEPWLDDLAIVAVRDEVPDRVTRDRLELGGRYSRIDIGHPLTGDSQVAGMEHLLRKSGIRSHARNLAMTITPWICTVVEEEVVFAREQVLLYGEGDYLGPHNDRRSGHRFNVQLPMNWNSHSGLRIFQSSGQVILPDKPGVLRILGPQVWHEVMPFLPIDHDQRPHRAVLSLRFESAH